MEDLFNPFSLSDKLVLITGASSGIGRQCAISCSKMGALVVLFGRDKDRLKETRSVMLNNESHLIYCIDLTEYENVGRIIENIVIQNGRISGLINCAGISTTLPFNSLNPERIEHFFRTNVMSAVSMTKYVVKAAHFSESGGSVIFISSVMGSVGATGKTLYSMTKGSINSLVKSLALELAPKKIRVNSISPGVVKTPMSNNSVYNMDGKSMSRVQIQHPLGIGLPEDIANACIFLLSDASRWVTGSNLIVDGGYLAS